MFAFYIEDATYARTGRDFLNPGGPLNKKSVLILLYPGCIPYEVALAAELLSEKYRIINATPDGTDLKEYRGLPLKTQLSYPDVTLEECAAVLVPGGNPDSVIYDPQLARVVQEAHQQGLLIGAICAGPSILGQAGILKSRRISHGYAPEQLEYLKKNVFADVTVTDELFTADGMIVTAKPEAHIEFGVEIACRLDAVDASKSERLKEYYRGRRI